ncbi:hypothetical protein V6N13_112316 [Hibiscus sabdariffa]
MALELAFGITVEQLLTERIHSQQSKIYPGHWINEMNGDGGQVLQGGLVEAEMLLHVDASIRDFFLVKLTVDQYKNTQLNDPATFLGCDCLIWTNQETEDGKKTH